jgi:hypothetical protein
MIQWEQLLKYIKLELTGGIVKQNPCKKCLVLAMCKEECWKLMIYINQQVSAGSGIGGYECSKGWLHYISRRILEEKRFTHIICINDSYYCMMVRDRDIKIVNESTPWRWFNK